MVRSSCTTARSSSSSSISILAPVDTEGNALPLTALDPALAGGHRRRSHRRHRSTAQLPMSRNENEKARNIRTTVLDVLVQVLCVIDDERLSSLSFYIGLIRPKTSRSVVHCYPRSSSGSIFAINPAKWRFSGLLSRLQPLSTCNPQRWRDDGAFCVDVPSKCDGGQPSRKGAFYEFQLGEGRRGTTSHCIAVTGPIVANRAALERARRGG